MEVLSLVNYYARLGYYRHVQTVCAEVLKKRANDPLVSLWKAFGMIKEGAAGEAVRELEAMLRRADPQMQLPLKIARCTRTARARSSTPRHSHGSRRS